jgi:hydrogenase maturation protein HypF
MSAIRGAKLHITGIVQGVGFRPFIYGLAIRLRLTGWVRNTSAGVEIELDGPKDSLDAFLQALKAELPPLARMDSLDVSFGEPGHYSTFEIIPSEVLLGAFQPVSPDVSICDDCLRELFDPNDRRYRYPFINCTNCGPRFTIITDIPYDRPNTTMAPFAMCLDCASEYQDPLDRRFHAQPVACPACGPGIWLEWKEDGAQMRVDGDKAVLAAQEMLIKGLILAVKGLGGFHLACDATRAEAVTRLRQRKLRVDKPFALMMPDIATVERYCFLNQTERELLESRQRPIVLLRRKPDSEIAREVAPGQNFLGVMLPYTPLHYLLIKEENQRLPALVMTSGNLSEEPIATGNDSARQQLSGLADAFLLHDREIHTRCDDSVVRVLNDQVPAGRLAKRNGKKKGDYSFSTYFLRRSRGYAPDPLSLPFPVPPILAAGPELKNTFCLTRERYAFLSHHIGDMENYETLRSFQEGISYFERLFRIKPEIIAYDLHPNYLASRYSLERAGRENLPAVGIQHHHAHIAACLADNGINVNRPVIGLAFDGTGYGEDGAIWGGEVLVADYAGYQRKYHLEYFPLPGGDNAIRRPALTALGLLWSLGMDWEEELAPVQALTREEITALRIQLQHRLNAPLTSSLGRLFDAVAALAGVRQQVNYEAQAAIEFESILDEAEKGFYRFEIRDGLIDVRSVVHALLKDLQEDLPAPLISARFHNGIVELVQQVCMLIRQETGINEVALSGGVWQNMALLKNSVKRLQKAGFTVYLHHQVPTNDGGISLGQALIAAARSARD